MLIKSQRHLLRLVVVLLLIAIALPTHAANASKKVSKSEPTIAVLYFDYAGNDPDMAVLKKGLANMLITDLVEVEGLKVVERARLQDLLAELKLNKSKTIDRRKAVQIGKMVGALYIVVGHYLTFKNQLLIEARLLDTSTSVYVGKFKARVRGPEDDFFELQQTLSQQLQDKLVETLPKLASFRKPPKRIRPGIKSVAKKPAGPNASDKPRPPPPPSEEEGEAGFGKPGAAETARVTPGTKSGVRLPYKLALLYAKALDRKDQGDVQGARALLTQLLKKAPGFQLAHTGLAELR